MDATTAKDTRLKFYPCLYHKKLTKFSAVLLSGIWLLVNIYVQVLVPITAVISSKKKSSVPPITKYSAMTLPR